MRVCFGGSFNPPTKAHLAIIDYLAKRYQEVIIVPNGNSYERKELIPFKLRVAMLKLMIHGYNNIVISDYEMKNDVFLGTVMMLRHFNHPLFVIGADNLLTIKTWINYDDLIKENHFLVFPRNQIDAQSIIQNDSFLKQYQNHFQIITDFEQIEISSTEYRNNLNEDLLTKEVLKFIKENNLYEVNSCIIKNS
ncbi:MAG: nicotinate (nicotinamide) nucleotide adenylyltransferase [Bacilli bacterium]|jgi:nicotinate-nucleotide adenylyltransferase|nr:nicotinate (nicotinamide) nucleotide adenylyltransferase [Acholeplasmataceae bacterium]